MENLFTENRKKEVQKLVALILDKIPVESIYLLGATSVQETTNSVFMNSAASCSKNIHYYFLVLVGKNIPLSHNEVQDRIENNCRSIIPVTAIVLGTEQFNNWLQDGHPFAQKVYIDAELLHNSTGILIAEPKLNTEFADKSAKEDGWTNEYNKVNELIIGAELYFLRKQNSMALCMLRQAAEMTLKSIFRKATGLQINTHNLDKWVRYCSMISYKILLIFARDSDKNERLFLILQKSKIERKEMEGFKIYQEDIIIITERLKELQKIMLETSFINELVH